MSSPRIPIENIYYLFCYAWDRFEQARTIGVGTSDSPDLANLLAKVLVSATETLLRRGLDREYQLELDELATIRGKIDIAGTLQLRMQRRPGVSVEFDELSVDNHQNRVLKALFNRLAKTIGLSSTLSHQLLVLVRRLKDVADIRLVRSDFANIRLHRNNSYYGLALAVARLAFDCQLPSPDGRGFQFMDVLRDERKMARVFEDFLRNFYRIEQTDFAVVPLQMEWDATPVRVGPTDRLPSMRTDIVLRSATRTIIVDAKYHAEAVQAYEGSESFKSGNIYQIFAYIQNAARLDRTISLPEGMLIYPTVGREIDATYRLHDHRLRIASVDLAQPWRAIADRLQNLLAPVSAG